MPPAGGDRAWRTGRGTSPPARRRAARSSRSRRRRPTGTRSRSTCGARPSDGTSSTRWPHAPRSSRRERCGSPRLAAAQPGVNKETLRYYERRGLLGRAGAQPGRAPPLPAARRHDPARDQGGTAARVHPRRGRRPARRGQATRSRRGPAGPAREKLVEVEERIADLATIRDNLVAAIAAGCDDLHVCATSDCCPLPFAEIAGPPSTSPDSSAWTRVGGWWQCPGHDRVRPSRAPQRAFRARRSHRRQLRGRRPRQRVHPQLRPHRAPGPRIRPGRHRHPRVARRLGAGQRRRRDPAGQRRARPALPRPRQDAAHHGRRVPRGLGCARATLGRDRRARPTARPAAAARERRRGVVVHRNVAPSRVCHRRMDPAGDSRRSGAVGSARPPVGRDARHTRHPTRPRGPAQPRRGARAAGRPDGDRTPGGRRAHGGAARHLDRAGRRRGLAAGRELPVRECLLTILNEEWEHRLYAERDLAVLAGRPTS